MLFSIGIFQALYRCWLTDCLHTARYDAGDLFHTVLGVFGDFLLVVSANFIKDVDYYLINGIWVFVAPLCIYQTIWILRFLEMALLHTDPVSRQRAAADVIDHVQARAFMSPPASCSTIRKRTRSQKPTGTR